ncbi:hypothetical protein BDQ17DRAFT_209154 [Cyathus striatus]|nr:hypothetical protein BDQ17DRAFT_209154 [Cyathus striatus]
MMFCHTPHCNLNANMCFMSLKPLKTQSTLPIFYISYPLLSLFIMASSSAIWVSAEEFVLIQYLYDHISEAGDNGSFKKPTFEAAAIDIAPFHMRGAVKTAKMCQNKYTTFRKVYRVVIAIKEVSGWTWSDETGASITAETASTWDDYIARHPEAKPFRNRGWPYLHQFEALMPSATVGLNVFHPMASTPTPTPPPTTPTTLSEPPAASAVVDVDDAGGLEDDWEIIPVLHH